MQCLAEGCIQQSETLILPMPQTSASSTASAQYRITRRVTLVGAVLDFILGVIKIFIGWLAHSQALIADGIHSMSDLATDVMVILAARHGSREADEAHPYGHDRIETVASVILASVLAAVALGIAYDSLSRLASDEDIAIPGFIALVIAAISAALKEGIYHYTMRAAIKLDSRLLAANAWHSRSDALSSLVVMAGVGGALLGFIWADALAAVAVSLLILKVAWSIGKEGFKELIDTGLDSEELVRIRDTVLAVDGVRDMHELRTRRMGQGVLADLHVHVPSAVSVSEGHRIGDEVHARLRRGHSNLSDVIVHVDCEDDTEHRPSSLLPLREEVERKVRAQIEKVFGTADVFRRLTLHYLGGKTHMELWLTPSVNANMPIAEGAERLKPLLEALPDAGNVILLTEIQSPAGNTVN
ncbi:MAG: cation transporter [marine bacterium B5-7]|nr:MAG: cation transporter [marine bacterium B5-7]